MRFYDFHDASMLHDERKSNLDFDETIVSRRQSRVCTKGKKNQISKRVIHRHQ